MEAAKLPQPAVHAGQAIDHMTHPMILRSTINRSIVAFCCALILRYAFLLMTAIHFCNLSRYSVEIQSAVINSFVVGSRLFINSLYALLCSEFINPIIALDVCRIKSCELSGSRTL